MTEIYKISEMWNDIKPFIKEFIQDLGYDDKQASDFVIGYEDKMKTLPILQKLYAVEHQDGECMTAGFKKAGIDEMDALERAGK